MSNKSITILQLTRFGDILQTMWSIKNIKKNNPELKLNLIARKRFGKPLLFLLKEEFDNILLLDQESLSQGHSVTESLDQQLGIIKSWDSDVLVNLSFSKTSTYLTRLINSKFTLGLGLAPDGNIQVNGTWSEFLYSTVMRGPLNPFSIVDIFRFILGAQEKPILPTKNIKGNQILIHPFASQNKKAWSPSKWSEIIFKTLKKNQEAEVLIVGSKNDLEKGLEITSTPLLSDYSKRIRLECGSLNLEEVYHELKQSFLFCGHDSMVGHLASLAGTQALTISLGTVRPDETSPYGINNFVLSPTTKCFPCFPDDKCSDFKCHKDLSYQLVHECLQQLIDCGDISFDEIKANVSPLHLTTAEIYKSSISKAGFFSLKNISNNEPNETNLIKTFYRIAWLYLLEGKEEPIDYPHLNKASQAKLETLIPNLRQLFELSEFGKKYSRFILEEISKDNPNVEYIKECGNKIEEIDHLQELVGKASPQLLPIIDFFTLKKSKIPGSNLVELCSSSYEIYESTGCFCNVLYDLIDKSLNEFKINNKNNSMKEAKE